MEGTWDHSGGKRSGSEAGKVTRWEGRWRGRCSLPACSACLCEPDPTGGGERPAQVQQAAEQPHHDHQLACSCHKIIAPGVIHTLRRPSLPQVRRCSTVSLASITSILLDNCNERPKRVWKGGRTSFLLPIPTRPRTKHSRCGCLPGEHPGDWLVAAALAMGWRHNNSRFSPSLTSDGRPCTEKPRFSPSEVTCALTFACLKVNKGLLFASAALPR